MTAASLLGMSSGIILLVALPIAVAQGEAASSVVVVLLVAALVWSALVWLVPMPSGGGHLLSTLGRILLAFGLLAMCGLFFLAFGAIVALLGAVLVGIDLLARLSDARSTIRIHRIVGMVLLLGPVGVGVIRAIAGVASEGSFLAMAWCTAVSLGLGTFGRAFKVLRSVHAG